MGISSLCTLLASYILCTMYCVLCVWLGWLAYTVALYHDKVQQQRQRICSEQGV